MPTPALACLPHHRWYVTVPTKQQNHQHTGINVHTEGLMSRRSGGCGASARQHRLWRPHPFGPHGTGWAWENWKLRLRLPLIGENYTRPLSDKDTEKMGNVISYRNKSIVVIDNVFLSQTNNHHLSPFLPQYSLFCIKKSRKMKW